jgi:xylan 1,4-beta-xylosidase
MGSPQQPTTEQYAQLQTVAGLQLLTSPTWIDVVDGKLDLATELPRQSISLVTITW